MQIRFLKRITFSRRLVVPGQELIVTDSEGRQAIAAGWAIEVRPTARVVPPASQPEPSQPEPVTRTEKAAARGRRNRR